MLLDAWRKELKKQTQDGLGDYGWPVLIVDEANRLMPWSANDDHKSKLVSLLDLFVRISKETNCCHVLMATSEYGFQTWLTTGERGHHTACSGTTMTFHASILVLGQNP